MPVSGIVILCAEGSAEKVAQLVGRQRGVEVHGVLPDHRIVAVVEADSVNEEVDVVSALHEFDGVISVQVAYHNFEDVVH